MFRKIRKHAAHTQQVDRMPKQQPKHPLFSTTINNRYAITQNIGYTSNGVKCEIPQLGGDTLPHVAVKPLLTVVYYC